MERTGEHEDPRREQGWPRLDDPGAEPEPSLEEDQRHRFEPSDGEMLQQFDF